MYCSAEFHINGFKSGYIENVKQMRILSKLLGGKIQPVVQVRAYLELNPLSLKRQFLGLYLTDEITNIK